VLDEADRILDMGFDRELRAIVRRPACFITRQCARQMRGKMTLLSQVQALPDSRQTLLFSATLSKSVRALAQLSLKSPEYAPLQLPAANDCSSLGLCFAAVSAIQIM